MRRTGSPKPIGDVIGSVLSQMELEPRIRRYRVLDLWPRIVGEQIARVTSADSISDGKLHVSVSRSTWRNELIFLKRDLIGKINDAMKEEIVKDIIFR